mgnify:FL=1
MKRTLSGLAGAAALTQRAQSKPKAEEAAVFMESVAFKKDAGNLARGAQKASHVGCSRNQSLAREELNWIGCAPPAGSPRVSPIS